MNSLKRKFKSNSGSSIILALALMLICVMVSSVIVSSAASGTSRNFYRTEQQRDYLAVSAASELIAKNLKGVGEYVGTTTVNQYKCEQYNNPATIMVNGVATKGYWVPVSPIADTYSFYIIEDLCNGGVNTLMTSDETNIAEGPFGDLMKYAAEHVYMTNAAYSDEFTISVPVEEAGMDRLPKVQCQFNMTKNYDVSIVLTSENPDSAYTLSIELNADVQVDESGHTIPITCAHDVCYKIVSDNGSLEQVVVQDYSFSYEATVPETHVTWSTPIVTKEVEAQ